MSVAGLCEICEAATVFDSCDRCGRVVCKDHYDAETGYCTDCTAEIGRMDDSSNREKPDYPDGVDEYRF